MQDSLFVLACDIGGSHITSAVVDSRDWSIVEETIHRSSVDSASDAKTIFEAWTSNMQTSLDKFGSPIKFIGIAMPGPFDYEKGISLMNGQSKYDSLYNIEVTQHIKEGLRSPIESILYINDAAAFLQGEVFAQGLEQEERILGVTLGTGLGSSVWNNGQKAFDADLWNSSYKSGIFEEHLATRWFTNRFRELSGHQEKGLKEILKKHPENKGTSQLLDEYLQHLYDFLHFFKDKYEGTKFIIGGNIAKAWDTIVQNNPDKLEGLDIKLGKHPEFAAIIGAATLHRP